MVVYDFTIHMKAAINVTNLVKRYGDFAAVDDISFTVEQGGFFGFLGSNGAGKSTTMRILSTLLAKTSGDVVVQGHDVAKEPEAVRRSIGFAMQNISLDNAASGYENLQLLGVLYGLSPVQSKAKADELLELVGLTKVAGSWVSAYSGGMRRRLDLAGVLMHSPDVLFLDEPTESLDPQARRAIWEQLQRLNKAGTTMFLTTHYMEEADALCRDLAFIDKGKIIKRGTPQELKMEMGGDAVHLEFADKTDMAKAVLVAEQAVSVTDVVKEPSAIGFSLPEAGQKMPALIRAFADAKMSPVSLSVTPPTLEDLFVKLIGRKVSEEDASGLVKGVDPFIQNAQ